VIMKDVPRVVIFANGLVPDPDKLRPLLNSDDFILCADGGICLALTLDLTPHIVIGDMDSISGADLARIEAARIPVRQYSPDKDETDLELAIKVAVERKPSVILILGALGGRLDHILGNISILMDPSLSSIDCRLDDGVEEVILCRDYAEVRGTPGDLISLVPWGSPVTGARTDGLRWRLVGETLLPHRTRGISNEMLGERAAIRIDPGLLLVVHSRRS
jgi:thiamine pyrophosphokinase